MEEYLKKVVNTFKFEQINNLLDKAKGLNVLVIGDTIIDHYVFVELKGRAVKDPILSVEYSDREIYPGGILAIANHIGNFVNKIKLITLTGDQNPQLDFITNSLGKNIELKTFTKKNSPTTVKKRIVNAYRNNKLFKIEYINEEPINEKLTEEITAYLDQEITNYDLVVVGDFGHGFINKAIRRKLEEKAKYLAVNTQSNSANMGYNYFGLYNRFDFICINETELRLPLFRRFEDLDEVAREAYLKFNLNAFLLTLGKNGCLFANQGDFFKAPAVITSVKDTVGAGDALFAITSLIVYLQADNELVPFIANSAGGIAANIMGNKESVTKEKLLDFIGGVYEKNGMGRL